MRAAPASRGGDKHFINNSEYGFCTLTEHRSVTPVAVRVERKGGIGGGIDSSSSCTAAQQKYLSAAIAMIAHLTAMKKHVRGLG